MANKRCAFCGAELGLFNGDDVQCAGCYQPACKDCAKKLKGVPLDERSRLALAAHPTDWKLLQAGLEAWEQGERQKEEEREARRQARCTGKTCTRCGGQMLSFGTQTFKLGEETFLFSDINRLASGSLSLEVLYCESCKKVELFLPEGQEEPQVL